jgi:phage repressor protein C with HTH and peptisase S24 domain
VDAGLEEPARAFAHTLEQRVGIVLGLFETRAEASRVAGVNPNQLAKYVNGKAEPSFQTLQRLADAKGVSLDWLAGRGSEMFGSGTSDDYVEVAYLEAGVSSGHGRYAEYDDIKGYLKFRRAFIEKVIRAPVDKLFVARNYGTSNEPWVNDGDVVLIDRSVERIIDDAGYVIGREGALLLKMVERQPDGRIALRSRNPDFKLDVLTDEEADRLHIFGRMRWHAGMG